MPSEITMPALSPTMEKGTIARWLVREGDRVRAGDVLAEIETDKASMEVEAADDGVVSRIMVADGTDDVPVGAVIALIGEATAAAAPADAAAGATAGDNVTNRLRDVSDDVASPAAVEQAPQAVTDTATVSPPAAEVAPARPAPVALPEGRSASPLVRRIAQIKGIDLSRITGSGPRGKIIRADLGLPEPGPARAPIPVAAAPVAPTYPPPDRIPHEAVRLSGMRRTIAARLTEAKQTIPHFYLTVDVRLDALLALRRDLNTAGDDRLKLSVNDLLLKALALALELVPDANVQFGGDQLYRFRRVDVAMAVAIPGGLITPILVDAAGKRLRTLAAEARDLARRARAGQLAPEEYTGGTASLSNLGMFGMTSITPILSPPQALILGIGAGVERPWVTDGALTVATVMTATGSFDHRAIDGAVGAAFMRSFKDLVERPLDILT